MLDDGSPPRSDPTSNQVRVARIHGAPAVNVDSYVQFAQESAILASQHSAYNHDQDAVPQPSIMERVGSFDIQHMMQVVADQLDSKDADAGDDTIPHVQAGDNLTAEVTTKAASQEHKTTAGPTDPRLSQSLMASWYGAMEQQSSLSQPGIVSASERGSSGTESSSNNASARGSGSESNSNDTDTSNAESNCGDCASYSGDSSGSEADIGGLQATRRKRRHSQTNDTQHAEN